jgi:hypothetical protein
MIRLLIFIFSVSILHSEELSLFPSDSLDDWTVKGSAKWSYQDGTLSGGQDGDPKRSGLLISKAKYQDFDLSLDFKIDEHGKYNSGIYLRYHSDKEVIAFKLTSGEVPLMSLWVSISMTGWTRVTPKMNFGNLKPGIQCV